MLQSFHQSAETFEILFNKAKYDALPAKLKAIIAYAVEAACADMTWKAIDRYSQGLHRAAEQGQGQVLQDAGHRPAGASSTLWDEILEKKSAENPLFKKIVDSQKAFAERAVKWTGHLLVRRRDGLQPLLRRQEG